MPLVEVSEVISAPVQRVWAAAKNDGRLPMDDFNTRVVTIGRDGGNALALAAGLAQTGFNNVKFYGGALSSLRHGQGPMARRF